MLLAFVLLWDWLWDRAAFRVMLRDQRVSKCYRLNDAREKAAQCDGRVLWDASRER